MAFEERVSRSARQQPETPSRVGRAAQEQPEASGRSDSFRSFSTARPPSFGAQMEQQPLYSSLTDRMGARAASVSQSQTMRGDYNPYLNSDLDQHIDDSDEEEEVAGPSNPRTPKKGALLSTPPPTKPQRKSRHADPARRLTIDPPVETDSGFELTITDNRVEPPEVHVVKGVAGLKDHVAKDPDKMFDNLVGLHETFNALDAYCRDLLSEQKIDRQEISQLQSEKEELSAKNTELETNMTLLPSLRDKLAIAKDNADQYKNDVVRLRDLRNQHKTQAKTLRDQVISLRMENDNLHKQLDGFKRRTQPGGQSYINDSDEEDLRRQHVAAREIRQGYQTPAGTFGLPQIIPRGNIYGARPADNYMADNFGLQQVRQPYGSRKHEELAVFEGDRSEWRGWKNHLLSQVQACPLDFPDEKSKINYARNKTRKTAQETIWFRAAMDSTHPYTRLEELVQDLEAVYGEDSEALRKRHEQELFSTTFPMGAPGKEGESLETFLARFISTVAPLQLSDSSKINHLERTLAVRYIHKTHHLEDVTSFQTYVAGIRKIETKNKAVEARPKLTTNEYPKSRTTRQVVGPGRVRDTTRVSKPAPPGNYLRRFPPHVQKKIIQEGRCGKCFKKGHVYTQADAPCKNEEPISMRDGQAQLAKMGIDWDGQYLEEVQPETEDVGPELYEEYLPNDHTSEFSEN